jgi:transposase
VDATTLEANAALRSIVRRDTESGIETPTREESAKLDRKRKKKGPTRNGNTRMIRTRILRT